MLLPSLRDILRKSRFWGVTFTYNCIRCLCHYVFEIPSLSVYSYYFKLDLTISVLGLIYSIRRRCIRYFFTHILNCFMQGPISISEYIFLSRKISGSYRTILRCFEYHYFLLFYFLLKPLIALGEYYLWKMCFTIF
jgi:hypothetical protein